MAVDFQLQHDILTTKTSDNELFTPSSLASANKALDTKDKRIVGAINELKKDQLRLEQSTKITLSSYTTMLGDFTGTDQELWEQVQQVGPNILSIVKLYNEKITSLESEIRELKENGVGGGDSSTVACSDEFKSVTLPYNPSNVYELPHLNIPVDTDLELTINGVETEENIDFTVNRELGTFTWIDNEDTYTLSETDRIMVQYYIDNNSTERITEE